MKRVEFDIGLGRSVGEVVKENTQTVIVELRWAGKTIRVKRHIIKHRVIDAGEMD